ncbi:zeta toxin family protein [Pinibacter aurantiacus]|uniref:Zeta toxin family protein n=1 Tax=Pinibacter aurantiacus TaxID=2851599 RepID=A0A9E2W6Y8_9BACT|nr:zeta toxin family protein [Pinibacter aurantiacus]MBV4360574.1 zeta toxin family protein [Pinibacter aurantiacus]
MSVLYIITGSNGAGKSSVGPDYIPSHLRDTIFDGDKLFMQKRKDFWNDGVKSHKECKKLAAKFVEETFDDLVEAALNSHSDFAYEGHFTNDATWSIPQNFKDAGYEIHLIFFGLKDTALSETRVVARVNEGGHYVDPSTIAANFYGNLEKLDKYFPMFNSVTIIETSTIEHTGLVVLENGICRSAIAYASLPHWFSEILPRITDAVIKFENKKD